MVFMFREESGSVPVEEGEVYDVTIQASLAGDGIARIGVCNLCPGHQSRRRSKSKSKITPKYGFASLVE